MVVADRLAARSEPGASTKPTVARRVRREPAARRVAVGRHQQPLSRETNCLATTCRARVIPIMENREAVRDWLPARPMPVQSRALKLSRCAETR